MVSDVGEHDARPRRGETDAAEARHSTGFAIAASLTYAFAGVVLPLVGWCAGLAMVWSSGRWATWRKLVATLVPIVMTALVACAVGVTAVLQAAEFGPSTESAYPAAYDVAWVGLAVVEILTACVGLWLLRRARGRGSER